MLRPSNTGPTFSEARLPAPVLQPSAPPATFPGGPSSLPIWGRRFTSQDLSTLRRAGVDRGGGSEAEARRQGIFGALPLKQEGRWGHTSFSTWLVADDAIPAAPGWGGGRQQLRAATETAPEPPSPAGRPGAARDPAPANLQARPWVSTACLSLQASICSTRDLCLAFISYFPLLLFPIKA